MAVTGKSTGLAIGILVAATAVGAGILYFVPLAFFPPCPLHALTGLNCPGCGATRAGCELLHGHVLAALHLNALLVVAAPALLAVGLWRALSGGTAECVKATTIRPQWGWLIKGTTHERRNQTRRS